MAQFSPNAAQQFKKIRAEQNRHNAALRIAVLGGDCAGLNYFIGLDEFRAADDFVLESQGQTIYVDRTSAPYLWGATIDWLEVEDDAGFVVFNPNKGRSQSGCGSDGSGEGCMTKGDGNTCQKSSSGCGCSSGGCGSKETVVQIGG